MDSGQYGEGGHSSARPNTDELVMQEPWNADLSEAVTSINQNEDFEALNMEVDSTNCKLKTKRLSDETVAKKDKRQAKTKKLLNKTVEQTPQVLYYNDKEHTVEQGAGYIVLRSEKLSRTDVNSTQTQPVLNNAKSVRPTDTESLYMKSKDNRYKVDSSGPFYIYVEGTNGNIGNIHPMALGKTVFETKPEFRRKITDIRSVGRNRIRIDLTTAQAANTMVESSLFDSKQLLAYIPAHRLTRRGVIRNVDLNITDDELIQAIDSPVKVLDIRRMSKRVLNGHSWSSFHYKTCVLTFDSQNLPEYVSIYGMRCQVRPYVASVRQCFNCLRYDHISSQCRSQRRCKNCGDNHSAEECSNPNPFCVHCKGNHNSMDKKCPEYEKQKQIKKTSAELNIPYTEAKNLVTRRPYAEVATVQWPVEDERAYPSLPNAQHRFTTYKKPRQQTNLPVTPTVSRFPVVNRQSELPLRPIAENPYPPQHHNLPSQKETNTGTISTSSVPSKTQIIEKLVILVAELIKQAQSSNTEPIDSLIIQQAIASVLS